ncbi:MAG TPA: hypothetical protein VMD53_07160 [Rhizomicrobium sp.]|nr:hypothetical protein [Rhizomicrobium sp.]
MRIVVVDVDTRQVRERYEKTRLGIPVNRKSCPNFPAQHAHRPGRNTGALHDFFVRQALENESPDLFALGITNARLCLAWNRLGELIDVYDRAIDIGAFEVGSNFGHDGFNRKNRFGAVFWIIGCVDRRRGVRLLRQMTQEDADLLLGHLALAHLARHPVTDRIGRHTFVQPRVFAKVVPRCFY